MEKVTTMLRDWKSVAGVLAATLLLVVALIYVNVDRKYTVVYFAPAVQTNSPAVYKVEISPKKAFRYAVKLQPAGFVFGLIFLGIAVIWIFIARFELINFGAVKVYEHSNKIWFLLVLISAAFFYSTHGGIVSNNYINLSEQEYVKVKGDSKVENFYSKQVDNMFDNKLAEKRLIR